MNKNSFIFYFENQAIRKIRSFYYNVISKRKSYYLKIRFSKREREPKQGDIS